MAHGKMFMYVWLLKYTIMQIERALINDRLRVPEVSWKFHIPTIYNFAVIYSWNFPSSLKVAYLLTVSIVFSVYKQNFTVQQLKNWNSYEYQNSSICYLCWSDHLFAIIQFAWLYLQAYYIKSKEVLTYADTYF